MPFQIFLFHTHMHARMRTRFHTYPISLNLFVRSDIYVWNNYYSTAAAFLSFLTWNTPLSFHYSWLINDHILYIYFLHEFFIVLLDVLIILCLIWFLFKIVHNFSCSACNDKFLSIIITLTDNFVKVSAPLIIEHKFARNSLCLI